MDEADVVPLGVFDDTENSMDRKGNEMGVDQLELQNAYVWHRFYHNSVQFLMKSSEEGVRDRIRARIEAADPALRVANTLLAGDPSQSRSTWKILVGGATLAAAVYLT
eukprot:gene25808-biopygen8852